MKFFRRIFKTGDDMNSNTKIVLSALLIAFYVVNNRWLRLMVGIPGFTNIANLNFAIVSIVVAAFIMGPWWAAIVGGLGDLLGALLWPFGAYFPGFTFNFALVGVILGLFIYRKKIKGWGDLAWRLAVGLALSYLVLVGLHSLWMFTQRGLAFFPVMLFRAWTVGILLVIVYSVTLPLLKFLKTPVERFLTIDDDNLEEDNPNDNP